MNTVKFGWSTRQRTAWRPKNAADPPDSAVGAATAMAAGRFHVMDIVREGWDLVLVFAALYLMRLFLPLPFANEVVIFSIYAVGCNFLLGRIGLISFGQPAYLAVGAYAAACYLYYFGGNAYVGILVGMLVGLMVALLIGPFFVRLRGDYFALVNLALAVIVFYLAQTVLVDLTHGDNGLLILDRLEPTPVLDLSRPSQFFVFALLVAFAVWAFYKYIDASIYGACCLATKANENKLRFLGYSDRGIRLLAFVIANTTTALAGAMYAVYLGFVSPEMTSPARAADPLVVVILGGVGTLYGPIVGSIAYTGMKDLASKLVTNWELVIGLLLVAVMLGGERGIWGTLEPLLRRARARAGSRRLDTE
jgi:branched-chain amino acid transport system permease protein